MYEMIELHAPTLHDFFPEDYFRFTQSQLIHIEYRNQPLLNNVISSDPTTAIESNSFFDNRHFQVLTHPDNSIHGSLLTFDCGLPTVTLLFNQNEVRNNTFVGQDNALIHITGGSLQARGN